ncbi:hypothetical protein GCM10023317_11810 [Actinopolymorpha pittospori]
MLPEAGAAAHAGRGQLHRSTDGSNLRSWAYRAGAPQHLETQVVSEIGGRWRPSWGFRCTASTNSRMLYLVEHRHCGQATGTSSVQRLRPCVLLERGEPDVGSLHELHRRVRGSYLEPTP